MTDFASEAALIDKERLETKGIDDLDLNTLQATVDIYPPLENIKFDAVPIFRPLLKALIDNSHSQSNEIIRLNTVVEFLNSRLANLHEEYEELLADIYEMKNYD